MQVPLDPF